MSVIVGAYVVVTEPWRSDYRHVYALIGNDLKFGADGCGWLGEPTSRPATPRERLEARTPFNAPTYGPTVEPDEETLTDQAALKMCRREQETRPPDLIGRGPLLAQTYENVL